MGLGEGEHQEDTGLLWVEVERSHEVILCVIHLGVLVGGTSRNAARTNDLYALLLGLHSYLEYVLIEVAVTYASEYDAVETSVNESLHRDWRSIGITIDDTYLWQLGVGGYVELGIQTELVRRNIVNIDGLAVVDVTHSSEDATLEGVEVGGVSLVDSLGREERVVHAHHHATTL